MLRRREITPERYRGRGRILLPNRRLAQSLEALPPRVDDVTSTAQQPERTWTAGHRQEGVVQAVPERKIVWTSARTATHRNRGLQPGAGSSARRSRRSEV